MVLARGSVLIADGSDTFCFVRPRVGEPLLKLGSRKGEKPDIGKHR
jgi:hypothetical protein